MSIYIQKNNLKNFYLFLLGQFISQFGSKLTSYGLVLWSYKESGSVLSMSLLSVCYLVPEVMLSFISGGISDRWDKKKILLVSDAIAACFSLSVVIMIFTGTLRLEYLYLINFMLGVTDSFQNPAAEVTVSAIVARDDYMKTSGIRSFCNSFTGILAPIMATSLYALLGLKVIVLIDLATFMIALFTLAFGVTIPKEQAQNKVTDTIWSQCNYGMKYLLGKKDIFSLILFMGFVNLIAAVYNTNLAPMVLSRNGDNDFQLGIVSSMVSIASIIGSLFVTKIPKNIKRVPLILNIMTFSFLICNGLLGLGCNYLVWTFAVFAGNLFIPLLTANVEYMMRTRVPYEIQGKIFAARNTLQYTSIPVGNLLGGYLADKVFIPYIKGSNRLRKLWDFLLGSSDGSGIGLLYLVIAVAGVTGCFLFRRNKYLLSLDEEGSESAHNKVEAVSEASV